MKLCQIAACLSTQLELIGQRLAGSPDPDILSVHYDSRTVQRSGLFVAVKGLASDGHRFIQDAVKRGAAVVVAEKGSSFERPEVPLILVNDSRKALALVGAEFYGQPSLKIHLIGLTGTNGKTSTTYLIESIFTKAGLNTGVIGTINYRYGGNMFPNPMTTPESLDLQRILFDMVEAGVTHVVMEVSSHAIDLHRIMGLSFDTAVFTNLSQDHLDYHQTMDEYWTCKKRLFTEYLATTAPPKKPQAVINITDKEGVELVSLVSVPKITTGTDTADIRLEKARLDIRGIEGELVTPVGRASVSSTGIGQHNLENILCAAGAAVAAGVSIENIAAGLSDFNVPGRLERVPNTRGFHVFVDYAHTPDGLLNVLTTLRPLTKGRVITVFGCGGDRDNGKRPKMGGIAEQYSDLVIVTSDNPRTEDPAIIISHILQGLKGNRFDPDTLTIESKGYAVEADRRSAIVLAIKNARVNDTVLIAGKGHETYQILNTGTIDFDDRIEAKKALNDHE
jgi:UDP-N-acetylmuramyl-tripeptide synthetase